MGRERKLRLAAAGVVGTAVVTAAPAALLRLGVRAERRNSGSFDGGAGTLRATALPNRTRPHYRHARRPPFLPLSLQDLR